MKRHDISLDEALQQFLLTDDAEGPALPASGWLEGPLPHEYEAHVLGTKPFTGEQLAWVRAHPTCQKMLTMFEQHHAAKPIAVASLPAGVSAKVVWDAAADRGQLDLAFPQNVPTGMLVFLQRAGRGLARVARLGAIGRVSFAGLARGEYRVVPSLLSGDLGVFATVGNFKESASAKAILSRLDVERAFPEYGLHVSVKPLPLGEISVTFTSSKSELDGAMVHLAFAEQDTGVVLLSGAVKLQKHPSLSERWEGTWEYPLDFGGSCELTFTVEKQ